MLSRNKFESQKGIALSGNCCVICGWAKKDNDGSLLVVGAHVRQVKNVPDYDKHDNIIGLCPNHHAEFDSGNIVIDPGKMISLHRDPTDPFCNKKLVGKIDHIQKGYFAYQKKHTFSE